MIDNLINLQIQLTNEILLVIAGEIAIINSEKHLNSGTNKTIVRNIEDLAKDLLNHKNWLSDSFSDKNETRHNS